MRTLKYILGTFLFLGIVWSLVGQAQTVPTANTIVGLREGNIGIGTIGANGAAGTYQTIYTAPTAGAMLKGLTASNEDTSTGHIVTCEVTTSGGIQGIVWPTSAAIAAQSGTIAPVNMLSPSLVPGLPVDQWGNPFVYMPSGYIVKCTYTTALSNNYIAVAAQAGEF